MTTGYGWRRLLFWPWHLVEHRWRHQPNNWQSRLFCTFCVDDRLAGLYYHAGVSHGH